MGPDDSTSTAVLAEYAASLDPAQLPDAVVHKTRIVFADTLGVLLAASAQSSVATAVRAYARHPHGTSTVIGHGRIATPEVAAFINGIGGHDIELDDSHGPSRTHAASVIVPSALAAIERTPMATFGDLVAGIVAGYDVQARVSKGIGSQIQFDRGFHPSSVCGTIGSAVCSGRIGRLSKTEMISCIGLASSQSSGILAFSEQASHMAKSFQTGIAARNGLTASMFAAEGYLSAPDVLTGDHNMLTPFGGDAADSSQLLRALGEHYEISDTTLKRHACGAPIHAAIDALVEIMSEDLDAGSRIDRIDVELPHNAVPRVDATRLATQNLHYIIAVVALEGHIGREHFVAPWTTSADVAEMRTKVTLQGNDELEATFPARKGAIVTVTAGASTFTRRYDTPAWNSDRVLDFVDIESKFRRLAGEVLKDDDVDELWRRLQETQFGDSVEPILTILGSSA